MNVAWQETLNATPTYWRQFASLVDDLSVGASLQRLPDGSTVHLYESGPAAAANVILVSPAESPFLLMSRLFGRLSDAHRVFAWDNPAASFVDTPADLATPSLQRMADDLLGLIETRGILEPHLVTWCSGALIALWALSKAPQAIRSVTCIAPSSVLGKDPERTKFQTHFLQKVLQLASGTHPNEAALCEELRAVPQSRSVMSVDDQMILDLTGRNARDDDSLRRYARSIQNACTSVPPAKRGARERAYVEIVAETRDRIPMALLHCRDDDVVSSKCSAAVAADSDNVRLVIYPKGGHFVIFTRPQMLSADIASFIDCTRREATGSKDESSGGVVNGSAA